MTKREKRRLRALQRPTSLPIEDAIALMIESGWDHRRQSSSHHQFTKPGMRTVVIVEHGGKVGRGAVEDIVAAIEAAGD